MNDSDDEAGRQCPACHTAVPAVVFCGNCGAALEGPVDSWSILLRPRVFAAAPRESLIAPRMTSSLFPRLAPTARKPFRVALILLALVMAILAALESNAPMGATVFLGGPLIFLLYVWQSDALRDIPARAWAIAGVSGAVLATAWWLFTGRVLAGAYGVTTAAGLALQNVLAGFGLAVTLGGAVLMVLPPVIVRLARVPLRESLDGFVIGAFGALSYSSAAGITWMMPQIAAGLLDAHSADRMLADAVVYGIIDPLTSVAFGGLVGLALWFRPARADGHPRRARSVLILCAALGAVIYAGVWTVDSWVWSTAVDLMVMLTLTGLALLTIRFGVQIALLHGAHDPPAGHPVLCVHCETVVPDLPFCPCCGAAARASSRSSRRFRREFPPVPEPA